MNVENLRPNYMSTQLLNFKQAAFQVPDIVQNLSRCVESANRLAVSKKFMNHDESAAIFFYTENCGASRYLNNALRSQKLSQIEPWFSYLKLFDNAIQSLAKRKKLFCRGEPLDMTKSWSVGSIITWVRVEQKISHQYRYYCLVGCHISILVSRGMLSISQCY